MAPALLTAVDSTSHVHLIIGSNPLAGARCSRSLEVGANPIVIASETGNMHYGLSKRIEEHAIKWIRRDFEDGDLTELGREEVNNVVDAVFVTAAGKSPESTRISTLCRRLRIPVNVVDAPNLSTFTLLSTHTSGPLQVGVTTSGKGCKLASRIRREIASALPQDLGLAVERLGTVRRRIWEQDHANEAAAAAAFTTTTTATTAITTTTTTHTALEPENDDEESGQSATFNKLVTASDAEAAKARRTRWLAQICEYWPLRRLAAISDADVDAILQAYHEETTSSLSATATPTTKPILSPSALDARAHRGRIILAGAGPGHPDLLTTATLKALRCADVVLADKLVPAGVLELVPRRTTIEIARKFPGNADAAQAELHKLGLEALKAGKVVVRLKQGDPYLYGRGAEEVAYFRAQGFEPLVLPGVASALAGPLFAAIPVTHRAVSDQLLVCTGTGRKGAAPAPPPFRPNQTVVFLMALHRLRELVQVLTMTTTTMATTGGAAGGEEGPKVGGEEESQGLDPRSVYPVTTPCAVIERASCPDQRVIRTTLEHVNAAVEEEGSRPPGLLVVGAACEVLQKSPQKWVVEDGFQGLRMLEGLGEGARGLDGLREALLTPSLEEEKSLKMDLGVSLSA